MNYKHPEQGRRGRGHWRSLWPKLVTIGLWLALAVGIALLLYKATPFQK